MSTMTSPGQASIIGVIICLCANVLISLALNVQKLAHMQQQQHADKHNEQASSEDAVTLHDGHPQPGEEAAGVVVVVDPAEALQAAREENVPLLVPSSTSDRQGPHYGTLTPISPSPSPSEEPTSSSASMASGEANERAARKRSDSTSDEETNDAQNGGPTTEYLRSKLWWLGMALMLLGESGNFVSYGFAPASLVAPLGAVALLSNVVISPCLLHERFRGSDLAGILLAIVGSVTVVFASKDNDVRLDAQQLWEAICRKEFLIYAVIVGCLGVCLAWASTTRWGEKWVLVDVGVCATAGGATVLSTKGLSSLLSGGRLSEIFRFPITYGLVAVLAVTAVIQLKYLNKALQRFDSRSVIPSQFVLFTLSAITGAAVLFRDFENIDLHRLINFGWGCVALFAGVFILTRSHDDEEDDAFDTESTTSHAVDGVPVDLYLPTVAEGVDGAAASTLAAQRTQAARPASFGRRSSGRTRPAIPTSITTSSVPFWSGAAANASYASTASAAAWTGRTPNKRGIVALAPAAGGLSQGTYLLMGTSPGGNALRPSPSRARSLSQPSTPTRRRSRQNLRAPDASPMLGVPADSASRRSVRRRSTDLESGSNQDAA